MYKIGICSVIISFAIYFYIHAHNQQIELQLAIPPLQKKLREIRAANNRLQFEIERFKSPSHLMQLAEKPEFSHYKAVYSEEVLIIE